MSTYEDFAMEYDNSDAPGSRTVPNSPNFTEYPPDSLTDHWTDQELVDRLSKIEPDSVDVVIAILKAMQTEEIPPTGPIAKTLLSLVDTLRPDTQYDGEWLPEEILDGGGTSEEDLRFAEESLYLQEKKGGSQ